MAASASARRSRDSRAASSNRSDATAKCSRRSSMQTMLSDTHVPSPPPEERRRHSGDARDTSSEQEPVREIGSRAGTISPDQCFRASQVRAIDRGRYRTVAAERRDTARSDRRVRSRKVAIGWTRATAPVCDTAESCGFTLRGQRARSPSRRPTARDRRHAAGHWWSSTPESTRRHRPFPFSSTCPARRRHGGADARFGGRARPQARHTGNGTGREISSRHTSHTVRAHRTPKAARRVAR
jgi:hypothetical protein